jgi:hypothetical protein
MQEMGCRRNDTTEISSEWESQGTRVFEQVSCMWLQLLFSFRRSHFQELIGSLECIIRLLQSGDPHKISNQDALATVNAEKSQKVVSEISLMALNEEIRKRTAIIKEIEKDVPNSDVDVYFFFGYTGVGMLASLMDEFFLSHFKAKLLSRVITVARSSFIVPNLHLLLHRGMLLMVRLMTGFHI